MSKNSGGMSCALGSWALAAGAALLAVVLMLVIGKTTIMAALFLGALAFILLGLVFNWLFCTPLPASGTVTPGEARGLRAVPPGAGHASSSAGHGAATASGAASGATGAGSAGAAASGTSAAEAASGATAQRSAGVGGAGNAATGADDPASDARPDVRAATAATDAEAGSAGSAATAAAGSGAKGGGAKGGDAASGAASAAGTGSGLKPTTALPGQDELAGRKGSWKYEGGAAAAGSAAATGAASGATSGASVAQATPEAQAAAVEGPGTKPATLSAPREGGADDLKRIKGIGPKLEKLCHTLGFYHFDQIAAWTAEEVAWVDRNLEGFKGRVTRDTWVEQARHLASGGETAFSKKVDGGDIY